MSYFIFFYWYKLFEIQYLFYTYNTLWFRQYMFHRHTWQVAATLNSRSREELVQYVHIIQEFIIFAKDYINKIKHRAFFKIYSSFKEKYADISFFRRY